jgi:hypothetical protein
VAKSSPQNLSRFQSALPPFQIPDFYFPDFSFSFCQPSTFDFALRISAFQRVSFFPSSLYPNQAYSLRPPILAKTN